MPFTRILSLTVSLYLDKLKLKSELCLMTDPWAQLGCICLKCKTESILPTLGKKKKKPQLSTQNSKSSDPIHQNF